MKLRLLALLLAAPLLLGAAPQGAGDDSESPKAPSTSDAKRGELDALRKRCYGGRTSEGSSLFRGSFHRSLTKAVAAENQERIAYLARRLLQAGDDELHLVPLYLVMPVDSEDALTEDAVEACGELLDWLKARSAKKTG